MPKVTYNEIEFDSHEEMHFYWWCQELQEAGYIDRITPQPEAFQLSSFEKRTHIKQMKRVEDKVLSHKILNDHKYTYDFDIDVKEKGMKVLFTDIDKRGHFEKSEFNKLFSQNGMCRIEVKPVYDQNNMTRLAIINQKWVMYRYQQFINIIIPEKLFKDTFTPKKYLFTDKSKKKRKIKFKVTLLEEYIKLNTPTQQSLM